VGNDVRCFVYFNTLRDDKIITLIQLSYNSLSHCVRLIYKIHIYKSHTILEREKIFLHNTCITQNTWVRLIWVEPTTWVLPSIFCVIQLCCVPITTLKKIILELCEKGCAPILHCYICKWNCGRNQGTVDYAGLWQLYVFCWEQELESPLRLQEVQVFFSLWSIWNHHWRKSRTGVLLLVLNKVAKC